MPFELALTKSIYLLFNNLGLTPFWQVITEFYVLLCIGFLLLAIRQRHWILIAFYGASIVIGFGLKELITLIYFRARPYVILNLDIKANITPNAFYSTHTFIAFISALFIFFLTKNKWIRIVTIALATLIGFSRLALAQHYLSDVLAGLLVALIIYLITKIILEKYQKIQKV